ncbi:hypothetical protein ACGF4C_07215 [Streptomyces sp. NPDC048197]|uniref:hypothetical protein n=1 Tax=Streptomyces sp. NPDC048197 TaxID=3365511 RepID=UPI003718386B
MNDKVRPCHGQGIELAGVSRNGFRAGGRTGARVNRKRSVVVSVAAAGLATAVLTGCGVDGKIGNYDKVSVWPDADPRGQSPIADLTTLTPVTVECYTPGKTDATGFGYGATYKISYDGGSGYIDASTSIMSDGGAVSPDRVPNC